MKRLIHISFQARSPLSCHFFLPWAHFTPLCLENALDQKWHRDPELTASLPKAFSNLTIMHSPILWWALALLWAQPSPSVSSHRPEELSTLSPGRVPLSQPPTLVSPPPPGSCACHKPDSVSRLSQGWGSHFGSLQADLRQNRGFSSMEKTSEIRKLLFIFSLWQSDRHLPFFCLFAEQSRNKGTQRAWQAQQSTEMARFY